VKDKLDKRENGVIIDDGIRTLKHV